jgi:hypothetical protein
MRYIIAVSLAIFISSAVSAADLTSMNNEEVQSMYQICLQGRELRCGLRGCVPIGDWPNKECVNIEVEAHRRAERAPQSQLPKDNTKDKVDWLNGMVAPER